MSASSSRTGVTEKLPGSTGGAMQVENEERVYSRYITVFNRAVRFPPKSGNGSSEGEVYEFDVVGHPRSEFQFTVVFPFHPPSTSPTKKAQVTLLKEYCQGLNTFLYCLPTGGFDPKRHTTLEECATAELSEEAALCGGEMSRLLPADHPGIPEVKWSLNRFTPFLVVAPEKDESPGRRDAEELIEVMRIDIADLKAMMFSGNMQTPSIVTCSAALDHLEKAGML